MRRGKNISIPNEIISLKVYSLAIAEHKYILSRNYFYKVKWNERILSTKHDPQNMG